MRNFKLGGANMDAPDEERTAHHVRRLRASIRDLHNALGVYGKAARAPRPPRRAISADTPAADDPRSRIDANNDRGAVQCIERLQAVGAAVLGLEGVGTLVADALCRYGVKRLVVGDPRERALGDLDFMASYVQDVGASRERHVAAAARRMDPEIHVFALDVPLADTACVVASLRAMLEQPHPALTKRRGMRSAEGNESDDGSSSEDPGGESSADDSDDSDTSDRSDGEDQGGGNGHGSRRRHTKTDAACDADDELCFSVVFLCGAFPELAMALNELCCEFGVQLVYVSMGRNGLSGDALSVAPGRSACLQCLEKRKMLKLSGAAHALEHEDGTEENCYTVGLPTTECVLAGIALQHAFAHLLGAGPICSRVEYDGFREEFDRSGFVAPVHLCPSANCRQQQQRHPVQRPPPTASNSSALPPHSASG